MLRQLAWKDVKEPDWLEGDFGNWERMLARAITEHYVLEVWENREEGENLLCPTTLQWIIYPIEDLDDRDSTSFVTDCGGLSFDSTLEAQKAEATTVFCERHI